MNDISIYFFYSCRSCHSSFDCFFSLVSSLNRWLPITHSNATSFVLFSASISLALHPAVCIFVGASFVDHISVIMLFHFDNRPKQNKCTASDSINEECESSSIVIVRMRVHTTTRSHACMCLLFSNSCCFLHL